MIAKIFYIIFLALFLMSGSFLFYVKFIAKTDEFIIIEPFATKLGLFSFIALVVIKDYL